MKDVHLVAAKLAELGADIDPYDFLDQYQGIDELVLQIEKDLQNEKRREGIRQFLASFIEEADESDAAEQREFSRRAAALLKEF